MNSNIIVVGSINMDFVVNTSRIPEAGETLKGQTFNKFPGGKGANQAVAVKKLGEEVSFIGSIGDDEVGKKIEKHLRKSKIRTDFKLSNCPTGTAHIMVTEKGENYIIIIEGANKNLLEKDIENKKEKIEKADFMLCQLEIPLVSTKRSIEIANQHNTKVILDPAPAQKLSLDILSKVDYLLPNEEEIKQLYPNRTGYKEDEYINLLLENGVNNVILTQGEKGATIYNQKYKKSISAPKVKTRDTTGAGDAFAGGLVVGLKNGLELQKAVKFGVKYASLTTTKRGAQNSFFNTNKVEDLY